jgi:hypothetical protein
MNQKFKVELIYSTDLLTKVGEIEDLLLAGWKQSLNYKEDCDEIQITKVEEIK